MTAKHIGTIAHIARSGLGLAAVAAALSPAQDAHVLAYRSHRSRRREGERARPWLEAAEAKRARRQAKRLRDGARR
jgi:hypothetical protein